MHLYNLLQQLLFPDPSHYITLQDAEHHIFFDAILGCRD